MFRALLVPISQILTDLQSFQAKYLKADCERFEIAVPKCYFSQYTAGVLPLTESVSIEPPESILVLDDMRTYGFKVCWVVWYEAILLLIIYWSDHATKCHFRISYLFGFWCGVMASDVWCLPEHVRSTQIEADCQKYRSRNYLCRFFPVQRKLILFILSSAIWHGISHSSHVACGNVEVALLYNANWAYDVALILKREFIDFRHFSHFHFIPMLLWSSFCCDYMGEYEKILIYF